MSIHEYLERELRFALVAATNEGDLQENIRTKVQHLCSMGPDVRRPLLQALERIQENPPVGFEKATTKERPVYINLRRIS